MMKLSSLLAITLFGIMTYLGLALVAGSYGFLAYHAYEGYVEQAEQQLQELEALHAELQLQVHRLTTDRETIRIEARDIGFIRPDETIIRLEGHEPRPSHRYMPGFVPPQLPQTQDHRPLFRAISLAVTLVAVLVETFRFSPAIEPRARRRRDQEWDVEVDGEPSGV